MKDDKLDKLLNKKVNSPLPQLDADPWLAGRIESGKVQHQGATGLLENVGQWSFASIIAACAIILGIFIGSNITNGSTSSDDLFSEYSQAFYQTNFVDDLENVISEEGVVE